MTDTAQTLSVLLTQLFQDGQPNFSITPQDFRDMIVSLAEAKINSQAANYTLTLNDDLNSVVEMDSASALSVTVPPNSSVAFSIGTTIKVYQLGAGQVTILPGAGVTLLTIASLISASQFATLSLRKRATDVWTVSGDLYATTWYVATTGNDSTGTGTSISPFLTIGKAATVASPGDRIEVASGTYTQADLKIAKQNLILHSTVKWGAKLVPPASSSNGMPIWIGGTTTDGSDAAGCIVDGFLIDASGANNLQWRLGIYATANNNIVRNCKVINILTGGAGGGSGAGIEGDGYYGASNITIHDNVIGNVGGTVSQSIIHGIYCSAPLVYAYNNLIYQCSGVGITTWHGCNTLRIFNNTIINTRIGIDVGSGDITNANSGGAHYSTAANNNTLVWNNIIANGNAFGGSGSIGINNEWDVSTGGLLGVNNDYEMNLIFNVTTPKNNTTNGNTTLVGTTGTILSGDPLFVNYQADGSGNYTLQAGSPAIDVGLASLGGISSPAFDLNGAIRPQGTGIDLGAYER